MGGEWQIRTEKTAPPGATTQTTNNMHTNILSTRKIAKWLSARDEPDQQSAMSLRGYAGARVYITIMSAAH